MSFLKTALKDFGHIGSLFPSTSFASRSVAQQVSEDSKTVVEYGAGDGVITRKLLEHLGDDAKVYAVEVNTRFVELLKQIDDPRLIVVQKDVREFAKQLSHLEPRGVDAIVSGIPFSFFRPEQRAELVENTRARLAEGGKFVVYQNSPLMLESLRTYFPQVRTAFEPRNILPYFIMVGKKQSD